MTMAEKEWIEIKPVIGDTGLKEILVKPEPKAIKVIREIVV